MVVVDHLLMRTATDSQLQASVSDEVRGAHILRHIMRILLPHVDHCGANFNSSRLRTDRRKQWER
jgi:hypothetical protein